MTELSTLAVPYSRVGRSGVVHFVVEGDLNYIERDFLARGFFYELNFLEFISAYLMGQPGVFVDVGAHIGNHSLYMSQVAERNVLAFEPNPGSFKSLFRNLIRNRATRKVIALNAALGASPSLGAVELDDPFNTGLSTVRVLDPDAGGDGPVVPVHRLDDLLGIVAARQRVVAIKMDVEGAELSCIEGAQDTIRRSDAIVAAEARTPEEAAGLAVFMRDSFGFRAIARFGATPLLVFASSARVEQMGEVGPSVAGWSDPASIIGGAV